jgi:hypothetical protein
MFLVSAVDDRPTTKREVDGRTLPMGANGARAPTTEKLSMTPCGRTGAQEMAVRIRLDEGAWRVIGERHFPELSTVRGLRPIVRIGDLSVRFFNVRSYIEKAEDRTE